MQTRSRSFNRHRLAAARHGAVAVELAIVTTIAFVFFFAAFEFCRGAAMEHTVNNAVYEGLRSGIVPGGDAAAVAQTSRRVLSTVGIDDARITVTPALFDHSTDRITVEIQVPFDSNSIVPTNFYRGKVIERSLTMRREQSR